MYFSLLTWLLIRCLASSGAGGNFPFHGSHWGLGGVVTIGLRFASRGWLRGVRIARLNSRRHRSIEASFSFKATLSAANVPIEGPGCCTSSSPCPWAFGCRPVIALQIRCPSTRSKKNGNRLPLCWGRDAHSVAWKYSWVKATSLLDSVVTVSLATPCGAVSKSNSVAMLRGADGGFADTVSSLE